MVPVSGFKTLGEVAYVNGTIIVTAKEGTLRVQGNGQAMNVANGKSITIFPGSNAPQGAAGPSGGQPHVRSNFVGISDAIIGGVGLVVGGVALSRASTASDNASSATSAAQAAASAAAQPRRQPPLQPPRRTSSGARWMFWRTKKDLPVLTRHLAAIHARK